VPYYVIEIHVYPFLPRPDVDPVVLQLHPIYQDEEEKAYFRGAASAYSVRKAVSLAASLHIAGTRMTTL